MILREFAGGDDAAHLGTFACSTGEPIEDDVEEWIRSAAVAWLNDVPRTTFQRRGLALIEDEAGSLVAVAAWQDIVRVDLEGIWLQVLAVATDHQHGGNGRSAYDLVIESIQSRDRDGDELAGLVHPDNHRSKRLLASVGWSYVTELDDHELWVGSLA